LISGRLAQSGQDDWHSLVRTIGTVWSGRLAQSGQNDWYSLVETSSSLFLLSIYIKSVGTKIAKLMRYTGSL